MERIEMDGLRIASDGISLSVIISRGRVTISEQTETGDISRLMEKGYREVASFRKARLYGIGDDPETNSMVVENGTLITRNDSDYLILHM